MSVIKFPTKLPPPERLELATAQLSGLLQNISGLLLARANELMKAKNASEFAAVVRAVAADTAEASTEWAEMSETIRNSWGI